MSIQSISGLSTYLTTSKTSSQLALSRPSTASPPSSAVNSNATDQVTLSDAAQKIIADDAGTTQHRTTEQENYIQSAMSDPGSAEKLASDMALAPSTMLFSIQGTVPGEPHKLSTGRIVDDSFISNFNAQASEIDAERKNIYYTETAKGTNPVAIIAMMTDFTNSQSKDYLEATAQLAPAAGSA